MDRAPARRARRSIGRVSAFLFLLAAACGGGSDAAETLSSPDAVSETSQAASRLEGGVLDVLAGDSRFTRFLELIEKHGPPAIPGFLNRPDWNHTVLAPTDDAFAALPNDVWEEVTANDGEAQHLIDHHIVLGMPSVDDLLAEAESGDGLLQGPGDAFTLVAIDGGEIRLRPCRLRGGSCEPVGAAVATLVEPDIEAANGLMHVIDTVLLSPSP